MRSVASTKEIFFLHEKCTSVNTDITNSLNSLPGKLFISFFSQGVFFFSFNWDRFLCLLILFDFVSLKLCETVSHCGLEGVSLYGSILIR